jgi:hypothetical protein
MILILWLLRPLFPADLAAFAAGRKGREAL